MPRLGRAYLGSGQRLGSLGLRPHGGRRQMGVHLRGSCLGLERGPPALGRLLLQVHHLHRSQNISTAAQHCRKGPCRCLVAGSRLYRGLLSVLLRVQDMPLLTRTRRVCMPCADKHVNKASYTRAHPAALFSNSQQIWVFVTPGPARCWGLSATARPSPL